MSLNRAVACAGVLLILGTLGGTAAAESPALDPSALRQEQERLEDLRMLHRYGEADLHDAKALALYLKGFGGADRSLDVEDLLQEAEDIYGELRGPDYGSMGLQAVLDRDANFSIAPAATADQLELIQRARRLVAGHVNDFYARSAALKTQLKGQVLEAAAAKTHWELVSKPEPWADAAREAGRLSNWPHGWVLNDLFFDPNYTQENDYSLLKAKKTGVTYAMATWRPASDWGQIEREPGQYDFSKLDEMMDRLARYGLRVCPMLCSLTGTPPQWLIDQQGPDCQFTISVKERKGKDTVTSPRQSGINLFHEPTGKAFEKFLVAYAAHLKGKYAGQVDGIYVEGGQQEVGAVPDESKTMDLYWKDWSKSPAPWRSPEALAADANGLDAPACARAEACREQWLLDYLAFVREGLKAGWKEVPVQNFTVDDDMHVLAHKVGLSRDYASLAALADNPATRTSSPGSYWMLRSFAAGKWIWTQGLHGGCGTVGSADYGQLVFCETSRTIGGSNYSTIRSRNPDNWYRGRDGQVGDFGIGSYFLAPRRSQELAPISLNTALPPAEVAVLWSQPSFRLSRDFRWHNEAIALGHLMRRAFIHFDYVSDAGLAAALSKYKVLLLPNTQAMATDTCDAIRQWVQAGGAVIGFGAPGIEDEWGQPRASIPLADVFGADVDHMRVPGLVKPDNLLTTHPEGAFQQPPPHPYRFERDLTAVLRPSTATPRGWWSEANEVAIVENVFGAGRAMLCGFPLGYEYSEAHPYEFVNGTAHHRQPSYNVEASRYEEWIAKELAKLGVIRQVVVAKGQFLRAQRGDDPDWNHVFRNGPTYRQYMLEDDTPGRTIIAVPRVREGIDNLYVGLANTEFNYFFERGYFVSTLSGGVVTAVVTLPTAGPAAGADTPLPGGRGRPAGPSEGGAAIPQSHPAAAVPSPKKDAKPAPSPVVVFDTRLEVPVPCTVRSDANSGPKVTFQAYLPLALSAAFAVAPAGNVRLFGPGVPAGEGPETIARRTAAYAQGDKLNSIEIVSPAQIASFMADLKKPAEPNAPGGRRIWIACGDTRYKAVADALGAWLKQTHQIDAAVTMGTQRAWCRWAYMDSFGYTVAQSEPLTPQILIGNPQDNGLMIRFVNCTTANYWLPLEVNENFPGPGRALVMLSQPVATDAKGMVTNKAKVDRQLVIGAGSPAEALLAVEALKKALPAGK